MPTVFEHEDCHDATGVTTPRQTVKASPHRHKWMLSHGAPADPSDPWISPAAPVSPRQNGQRGALVASAPGVQAEEGRALHVTDDTARHLRYTSRAKREADVSLSHRCTMEHHDATGVSPRDRRGKLVRTGINGCSAMAHPLTHLTHGIPTRRPFPPAKTASA